jgi:hypothetical protein
MAVTVISDARCIIHAFVSIMHAFVMQACMVSDLHYRAIMITWQ